MWAWNRPAADKDREFHAPLPPVIRRKGGIHFGRETTKEAGESLLPEDNAGRYLELMRIDKKSEAGEIRFVLIDGPGKAIVRSAPDALVRDVIDACCE